MNPNQQPELCPFCGRGRKIDATFTLNEITRPDPYCNSCGKNWPKPKLQLVTTPTRHDTEPA
jgi:hypothetical protein